MDDQLKTFMEISSLPAVSPLCDDVRAAWVWSADGARLLWANAAGARFFAVRDAEGLFKLSSLAKSPARPHIARIATSGPEDRMTTDRLRFYRGLRVMLLTCQGQKLTLPNGHAAALIVCSDRSLTLGETPQTDYLALLAGRNRSAGAFDANGKLLEQAGDLDLSDTKIPGPDAPQAEDEADLQLVQIASQTHKSLSAKTANDGALLLCDNTPIGPWTFPSAADDEAPSKETSADTFEADKLTPSDLEQVMESAGITLHAGRGWAENAFVFHDSLHSANAPLPDSQETEEAIPEVESSAESASAEPQDIPTLPEAEPVTHSAWGRAQDLESDEEAAAPDDADDENTADLASFEAAEKDEGAFHFERRRRPIRFAWQMDLDQRFTFLSDEFQDALGPRASDIVGLTWQDVSEQFGLDPSGDIRRALDRRDTWSGKTVLWPVSDATLRAPVDMAALPAFDRNRNFEGYRGFGVCRLMDAFEDATAPLAGPRATPEDALTDHSEAETRETVAGDHVEEGSTYEPPFDLTPLKRQPQPNGGGLALGAHASALLNGLSPKHFAKKVPAKSEETPPSSPQDAASQPTQPTFVEADTATPEASGPEPSDITVTPHEASGEKTKVPAEAEEPADDKVTTDVAEKSAAEAADKSPEIHEPDVPKAEDTPPEEAVAPAAKSDDYDGIGGERTLDAKDIETAVASLAKDFKAKTSQAKSASRTESQDPKDLFVAAADYELLSAENDDQASSDEDAGEPVGPTSTAGTASTGLTLISSSEAKKSESLGKDLEEYAPSAAGTDEEESFRSETTDYLAEDLAEEFNADLRELDEEERRARQARTAEAPLTLRGERDDAAELLEDTEIEEQEADEDLPEETEDTHDAAIPPEERGDNVVDLTRRRANLLPVDTSALSKPEIAAFRKIAEALGARLEDDLLDEDPELAARLAEDTRPPSAGPIDPRLLDRLPIGIAIVRDRDVLYANDTLLGLLGYKDLASLAEAGGHEAVFADDDEEIPGTELEGTVDETLKVRLAGGGLLSVDARMHTVPWNGGQGLMISVMERPAPAPVAASSTANLQEVADFAPSSFYDSEDHEQLERQLKKAEEQIEEQDAILETATDGILVLDRHGTILKSNRSAEALFECSRGDIVGTALRDFLAPESHRSALDYLDGLSRNGVASLLNDGREVLGQVASGGLIPLFMTIGRVNGSGEQTKFCAVLRDITHWKRAEEELTEAKRQAENASSQKSDFLAKISHEIRTPLNAIIGFSEVMIEERFGAIGEERYKGYLKDIRTSGSHILSLINDLLDLSKIEAGKMELQFSAVSANEIIRECVALMQPQANRDRVIIRASLPDVVPNVVADPRSLRQITLNLLSNAIKFNKSGGQVIISTALEDNGEVVLRVRDTGPGMSEKDLTAAMEPFRQLHTARLGGGTGLGLPLTKALTEANRANFRIDSTPEQGTLVEISFPSQRVLAE